VIVLVECYANTCLASLILITVGSGTPSRASGVILKRSLGRDRVIKKAHRLAQRGSNYVVIVIDYEKGEARRYV